VLENPRNTPLFPSVLSFKQYKLQCEFLHFIDNAELDVSDHLAKVSCPTDYFNSTFQTVHSEAKYCYR
jgi:hypothetical protein